MRSIVEVSGDRASTLSRLRGAIDAVSSAGQCVRASLATGWPELDRSLSKEGTGGGLAHGALHEWFGLMGSADVAARDRRRSLAGWTPPLSVLVHLALRAVHGSQGREKHDRSTPVVLWIGRRSWPYGHALLRTGDAKATDGRALFESSICVDAHSADQRFWSIDVALRHGGSNIVVIADASAMPLAVSRRLQLAAESGGALAFLARPPWEESELSVAATRWRVRTAPSPPPHASAQRWSIELTRCKGLQTRATALTVERTDDGRLVPVSADVVDRSRPAALAS